MNWKERAQVNIGRNAERADIVRYLRDIVRRIRRDGDAAVLHSRVVAHTLAVTADSIEKGAHRE